MPPDWLGHVRTDSAGAALVTGACHDHLPVEDGQDLGQLHRVVGRRSWSRQD